VGASALVRLPKGYLPASCAGCAAAAAPLHPVAGGGVVEPAGGWPHLGDAGRGAGRLPAQARRARVTGILGLGLGVHGGGLRFPLQA
jgi:hypothetical protein